MEGVRIQRCGLATIFTRGLLIRTIFASLLRDSSHWLDKEGCF